MPRNSIGSDFTNNADGFSHAGGTTKRTLTVTGSDVTLTGSGSATMTFPSSSATLVGRDTTDTLTNKTINTASNTITVVEADISDLQSYLLNITGEPLSDLSDVTITSIGSGEILKWNGSAWINNTLAEADVAAASRSLTAGSGLTGGGDLTSDRTFNIGAGTGITVNADDITVDIDGLTEEAGFTSGDFLMFYDTTIAALRKVDYDNLPGAGGGISNVVEDTTPQLGGNLDAQANNITDVGDLVVGHTSKLTLINAHNAQVIGTDAASSGLVLARFSADAEEPRLDFLKSRNAAIGSNTIVNDNDTLGGVRFYADDGVDYGNLVAVMEAEVDDASPASNDIGAAFVFYNAPGGGGGGATETLRIAADGSITFKNAYTFPTADGSADTALVTDGSGTLSFKDFSESKSISVESPTSSEDISMFFTNRAITITEMRAVLLGSSTPSVTWTIRHNATDRSAAGNEVVTSGTTTTSTTSGSDVTSFNDATIPADSFVWLETTAQSGTVDELHITLVYTID